MRISFVHRCIGLLMILQLSGCGSSGGIDDVVDSVEDFFREPDPAAIESTLKTTIPVGYAASLAMAAVNGDVAPNVTVVNGCSAYPCNALIYIDYDESTYPMPIEINSSGEIIVVGLWADQDTAILSVFFTDLNLYTGAFILKNVDIFPAVRVGNQITVVYADIDVNVGTDPIFPLTLTIDEISSELDRLNTTPPDPQLPPEDSQVSIEEEAWIVYVDNNGTSADFSDDLYEITGAGQFVGVSPSSAGIQQVVFLFVRMSHACLLNPTEGATIINDIEVSTGPTIYGLTLGSALITFHSDCDGEVDVTTAIGSYILSFGDSIRLDLTEN